MIRLGTLFSGIGAIEQALSIMKVRHTIVFACDNGELELKLLPIEEQKEYELLKKSHDIEYPKMKAKDSPY